MSRIIWLALPLSLFACASTKPTAARNEVAEVVEARGGPADVIFEQQDDDGEAAVRDRVRELLAEPLTEERALQIAVLNNRELRATFESLGVAQADLVDAGLLKNPVIGGDLIISTRGNGLGGGLSLSQSLLSAFLIPAKRRLAKAQLQQAVLSVTDATLALIRDVRVAHAEVRASTAMLALHQTLLQGAEVALELAKAQYEAGNITELDRELFAASLDEARLDYADHQLEVVRTREELNRLLGLWGRQISWVLADASPGIEANPDLSNLEALGIRQRLDVSAARAQVEAAQYAIELRRRGVIPEIEAGVGAGNEVGDDEGHEWVVGPSLSIEVPIFNPGHGDFARLRAHLRRAEHELQHTAVTARSNIREQREALQFATRRARYIETEVLPRREVVGARALERYNGMLIGAYELLEIRAQQVEAQQAHVEAVRDYWVAWAELERAVGGRLPSRAPEAAR